MEGSYGNVFPANRGMPPRTTSSSSDQYKVNISRQKTKKWANFKPQNYDGDEWGDEYDEQDDEPEPMPPPKPMGPRHPAANSPNSRQFSPAETSPFPSQAGPERRATAPIGSPQQTTTGSPVTAASNKPHPALSLFPKQTSPPPQNASSSFPPRKSFGPNDAEDASGSSPRSINNSTPQLETRSTFPQAASTAASQNKPLPFVRPADLYRRMEEERGQDRRQVEPEAAGPYDALGLQGRPQNQHMGTTASQEPHADWGLWTPGGLATVPERRSEYEIEGLLASYGSEEARAEPVTTQTQTTSANAMAPENLRRLSTSPQLPDLSRMSSFGTDLFSTSSFLTGPKSPSPLSNGSQFPTSNQGVAAPSESVAAGEPQAQSPVTPTPQSVGSLGAESKAPRHTFDTSPGAGAAPFLPNELGQPIGSPLHKDSSSAVLPAAGASEQQQPAADAPLRPSLPGGWVTETVTPIATPPAEPPTSPPAVFSQEATNQAVESQASPSKVEADIQHEVASLNVDKPRESESEEAGNIREAGTTNDEMLSTAHPASPRPLSLLRTSSPASTTKLDLPSQQATPKGPTAEPSSAEVTPTAPLNPRRSFAQPAVSPPSLGSRSNTDTSSNSPVKDSDVLSDEIIKSLSPMQSFGGPEEDTETAQGLTAAYHAAADSTRESSYLGDVYDDYWGATDDKVEPGPLATGKTGDPEKSTQVTSSLPVEAPKEVPAPTSGDPPVTGASSSSPPANVPEAQTGTPTGAEGHRRHFSWEAGLAGPASGVTPPATEPPVEQKVLGPGPMNLDTSTPELAAPVTQPLQLSPGSKAGQSTTDPNASSAPEVNQAAPAARTTPQVPQIRTTALHELPSRTLDSSSPASALSERRNKRLSLADEKILFQESTTPLSASPPLELHPALAADGDDHQLPEVVTSRIIHQAPEVVTSTSPGPGRAPSPPRKEGTSAAPMNIMGFRHIMEMPSPADRIKQYSEARLCISEIETGLNNWLESMLAQHPEHANPGFSYPGSGPAAMVAPGSSAGGSAGAGGGGGGQGLTQMQLGSAIHLPATIQHGLSGLGQQGNQMGTKSKELLMAAGKAGKGFGKGLLSKGRNKLRGRDGA